MIEVGQCAMLSCEQKSPENRPEKRPEKRLEKRPDKCPPFERLSPTTMGFFAPIVAPIVTANVTAIVTAIVTCLRYSYCLMPEVSV